MIEGSPTDQILLWKRESQGNTQTGGNQTMTLFIIRRKKPTKNISMLEMKSMMMMKLTIIIPCSTPQHLQVYNISC